MRKRQKDLVKGDIIRVEYGDYDNWVTVVIDSVMVVGNKYPECEMNCHYLDDGEPVIMYGGSMELVEVIGKEELDEN